MIAGDLEDNLSNGSDQQSDAGASIEKILRVSQYICASPNIKFSLREKNFINQVNINGR
jgi:hypothetical protein